MEGVKHMIRKGLEWDMYTVFRACIEGQDCVGIPRLCGDVEGLREQNNMKKDFAMQRRRTGKLARI